MPPPARLTRDLLDNVHSTRRVVVSCLSDRRSANARAAPAKNPEAARARCSAGDDRPAEIAGDDVLSMPWFATSSSRRWMRKFRHQLEPSSSTSHRHERGRGHAPLKGSSARWPTEPPAVTAVSPGGQCDAGASNLDDQVEAMVEAASARTASINFRSRCPRYRVEAPLVEMPACCIVLRWYNFRRCTWQRLLPLSSCVRMRTGAQFIPPTDIQLTIRTLLIGRKNCCGALRPLHGR